MSGQSNIVNSDKETFSYRVALKNAGETVGVALKNTGKTIFCSHPKTVYKYGKTAGKWCLPAITFGSIEDPKGTLPTLVVSTGAVICGVYDFQKEILGAFVVYVAAVFVNECFKEKKRCEQQKISVL